jgi:putative oxidoreductase
MNHLMDRSSHLFPSLREAWYAIPLRLIVGYGFMEHGYAKLARGPDDFASILHALGMPAATFLSWATILIELLGGLAVILGAYIPLASIPMMIVLLVAIFTVHLPNGFSSIKLQSVTAAGARFGQPGYETDLLYLACLRWYWEDRDLSRLIGCCGGGVHSRALSAIKLAWHERTAHDALMRILLKIVDTAVQSARTVKPWRRGSCRNCRKSPCSL